MHIRLFLSSDIHSSYLPFLSNQMSKTLSFVALLLSVVAIFLYYGERNSSDSTSVNSVQASSDSFARIVAEGTIKVCYVPWPPSISKDPNTGKLSGFMIDLMETISKDAELKAEYVESTWGGFAADLNAQKCDMWLGFYPLLNRAKTISFSKPFYYIGNNVMVKSDSSYASLEDVNTKNTKVAVIQGEFWHLYAQKFLPNAELVVLDASSDNTAPLTAVLAWQADAWMYTDDTITEFVATHSWVRKISDTPYSTTPDAFGIRQQDVQLLQFVNTAIDMLQAQGTFEALGKKYNAMWFAQGNNYVPLNK